MTWCAKVRQQRLRGELDEETFSALDAMGFDWVPPRNVVWEANLAKLKDYKTKHGDCNVPRKLDLSLHSSQKRLS